MTVRIVQLGSPRAEGEGVRIGTVRRPPRGVPKAEFASRRVSFEVGLKRDSGQLEAVPGSMR